MSLLFCELKGGDALARSQFKDALFRHLFNNKKNCIELYCAASGASGIAEEDVTMATIDDVFDNEKRNDVSFFTKTNL